MSDCWERTVEKVITVEARQLPAGLWPHARTRFWQLGFGVDREALSAAVLAMKRVVAEGSTAHPLACVAVLLHLLRTELPAVRANRLWPDVASIIDSGGLTSRERCATFFRDCLQRCFRTTLAAKEEHHKYVNLMLDEAGVGFDRSRIIREWLSRVLKQTIGTAHDDDVLREMLHDTLCQDDRPDVTALEPVLLRAGLGLCQVQRALIERADPVAVANWTWSDLSQFAFKITGQQLAHLIPEAESVFSALIPQLGESISCERAYELAHQGPSSVLFPPTYDARSLPQSAEDVPLAVIQIRSKAASRRATIVDSLGKGPDIVEQGPPDVWMSMPGGRHASIWRKAPFSVEQKGSGSTEARRVYAENDRIVGYAWSGMTWPGDGALARSHVAGVHSLRIVREPSIRPVPRWLWRGSRVVMCVNNVAFYDVPDGAAISIESEGTCLCHAEAAESNGMLVPAAKFEREWRTSEDSVSLGLRVAGRTCASSHIKLPRRPLVVFGRVIYRWEEADHAGLTRKNCTELLLIGDERAGTPECASGVLSKASGSVSVPRGLVAWIWRSANTDETPHIIWGSAELGQDRSSPRLEVLADREIRLDGFRIRGTGSVWPLTTTCVVAARLQVHNLPIGATAVVKLSCGPLLVRKTITDNALIGLDAVLSALPAQALERLAGLAVVSLEYEGHRIPQNAAFYIAPDRIECMPSRSGEVSRARLGGQGKAGLELTGNVRTGMASEAIAALTFPAHPDLEPGSGVLFTWHPEVFDVRLTKAGGGQAEGELSLTSLHDHRIEFTGDLHRWSLAVMLGGRDLALHAAQIHTAHNLHEIVVQPLNALAAEIRDPPAHMVLTAAYGGQLVESWTIRLDPVPRSISAQIAHMEQVVSVAVELEWLGLPSGCVRCLIHEGTQLLAQAEQPIGGGVERDLRCSAKFVLEIPAALCIGTPDPCWEISVIATASGFLLGRTSATIASSPVEYVNIPAAIRSLLGKPASTEGASSACRQVLVLFRTHLLQTGSSPFNAETLAANLERQLSQADCVGTAAACIRARGQMLTWQGVPSVRPIPSDEPSAFGLAVNDTLLGILEREAALGQLLPASLASLEKALKSQIGQIQESVKITTELKELAARCQSLLPI